MEDYTKGRAGKAKEYGLSYLEWMLSGRLRMVKIVYTGIWVTALVTFNLDMFLNLVFVGFLLRELLLMLTEDDYRERSYLMKLARIGD